jgi:2-keto-4-pentenoate hydratase
MGPQGFRLSRATPGLVVVAALAAGCASAPPADPTCPSDATIADMTARYVALQPVPMPPATLTIAGALCGRDKFTRSLQATQGPVIGYKAGLTNPAVQQRFGYPAPMRGTLFQKMMLRDGAEVAAKFGARPVFEADLVAVVKSSAIHDAKTPLEVLSHLSVIYPFLELPDLVLEDPTKINGPGLALINVGARYGVLGAPIPVQPTEAMLTALRDMTVRLVDGTGKELDSGKGSAILGQPANAVIWLADDLRKSGIRLKEGDLLSLGSFTRLLPPQPGMQVRAVYEGLPGNPTVGVTFR